ncbi:MAG TPA: alginate export family protein, partial [Burkholderiaceae bacterium]
DCLSPTRNAHSPFPKWQQEMHCIELPHESYLSFGGLMRFRYLAWTNQQFGLGPDAGVPPGALPFPGGPFPHHNNVYQLRIKPYMDLHLFNDKLRLFTALSYTKAWDDNHYDPVGQSYAEVHSLFLDYRLFNFDNAGGTGTLRFGRQEFGNMMAAGMNMTSREGENVRLTFDGFRFLWHNKDGYKIDAFAVRPVALNPYTQVVQEANGNSYGEGIGSFNDSSDNHVRMYGITGTVPWMHKDFSEEFYVINRNLNNIGAAAGDALAPTVADSYPGVNPIDGVPFTGGIPYNGGAGYAPGVSPASAEHLFLGGTRLFGDPGNWHYTWDLMYEWGKLGQENINAWGVIGITGYQFKNVKFSPTVNLQTIAASGGHAGDHEVRTFDPLYSSNGFYYGDNDSSWISNILSIGPSVFLHFSPQFIGGPSVQMLWKQTSADAVYTAGMNALPGTVDDGSNFIGTLVGGQFQWRPSFAPFWSVMFEYDYIDAGGAIRNAGGRNMQYFSLSSFFMF